MPISRLILLFVALSLVSGCASRKVCERVQPHLSAELAPPMVVPEGVAVAPQVERLRIPDVDAPRSPTIVREKAPDGSIRRIRCLEDPPELPAEGA